MRLLIIVLALFIAGCSSYDVEVYSEESVLIGKVKVTHFMQDRNLDSLSYDHATGKFDVNQYDTKSAEIKVGLLKLLLAL